MKRLFNFFIKRSNVFAWITFIAFTAASILITLNRYWQYEVFYYDFGIFDRAIWLVSQFKPPIIDHLVVGGKLIFADHFNPSIFIFSPLYWIIDKAEILLAAQSIAVGLSGFFIYKIGKIITKNLLFSLAILTSYYLFIGLQNAVISDFHEVTVAALFTVFCFYCFLKNKKILSLFFFILTLGFKESNFLFGAGLAVSFFFIDKRWRKFSIFLFILSIIWGVITIKLIIPYFSGGNYGYEVELSLAEINPIDSLLGNPAKKHTVFYSLLSFGFLPILSPVFWPLIVQDLLARFLSNRVSLGLHYSALLSVILAISSFYGFSVLRRVKIVKKHINILSLLIILNAIFLYRFVLRGPLALAYNPDFYAHTKDFQFLDNLVSRIPLSATVMAQNNLASHFTHNKNVWVLKPDYKSYKPEYIVFDLRSGQNINNFFPTNDIPSLLQSISRDSNYSAVYNNGNQYIFKRK